MLTLGNLSGLRLQPGSDWCQENYALMWYAAHVASPLEHTFLTTSLLLYVNMAADRAFAIASPLRHKALNHRKHQILAFVVSLTLGVSTSIFDVFRYDVIQDGYKYALAMDETYVDSTTAFVCDIIRNALRIAGNLMLIICNIAMVVSYHIKLRRIKFIDSNDQMGKRRSTQKTLLLLTLFQSFFQTVDMTLYNTFFTLEYSIPGFADCYGLVMAPLCDLVQQLAGTAELFALLTICRQFRRSVLSTLKSSVLRTLPWQK